MSKSKENARSEKSIEGAGSRAAKIYRTINFITATGLVAGAVAFPEYAPVLIGLAAIDVAQGGIVEYLRRRGLRKKEAKKLVATQAKPAPA